ncbi:YihY/virulence factor BrkB family protein [Rubrivirga sp. S365]|uniref:YihY/virulence factor BrkB family protein n=1 Tax=Rubrivirga litoralis TaxID=3075598 RepID=A0ABU3BTZ7_9BACT|nr:MULTISPECIES: YihY/virulence factor BrkB family protein [unclassified Rubrivirga]MDT0632752.1 YihY/virulence factor BrkB family protein [Rubrivirga sp. F394]MDT7856943.1 YihY/virulence factor BrkB family protein [Rubrivirga sp. S365]
MPSAWTTTKNLLTATGKDVMDDDVPSLSAAIAYYTVFSLPSLLVIIVGVVGAVVGPAQVEEVVVSQMGDLIGPSAGDAIRTMIADASDLGTGIGSKVAGLAALLFGATGAFAQLQRALNRAWEVEDDDDSGVVGVVLKRLLSFGMVLTIGFFLLVSLVVSAALTAIGGAAEAAVGGGAVASTLVQVANVVVGLLVIAALFTFLFRVLPDAEVAWRDAAVGGLATSILFTIGKSLIGIYLGTANPGSAFGAAGSLALILIWIYYSSFIVLVGAEFTQQWANRLGRGIDHEDEDVHPIAQPRDPAPY